MLKQFKPDTPSKRQLVQVDKSDLWKGRPEKSLTKGILKTGGRNNKGRITSRHIGGGHKQLYRVIDFKRCRVDMPAITLAQCIIDISDHTKKAGVENTGLRALAAHYLGLQMKKSKKVQTSNWAKPLDERQIQYAANDAWFGRELFIKLEKDGLVPRFE